MSPVKRWLKIVLVLGALGMLGMCAIAGAGVYYFSRHINTERVSSGDALTQFDAARARFKDHKPLVEIDANERVRRTREITTLPTAATQATTLVVMAWDPDEGRIVNLKLPLWILAMGQKKVELGTGRDSFDLRRLDLDIKELERVGSLLVVDVQGRSGERVLVWTE
jgi:hypothetical protein